MMKILRNFLSVLLRRIQLNVRWLIVLCLFYTVHWLWGSQSLLNVPLDGESVVPRRFENINKTTHSTGTGEYKISANATDGHGSRQAYHRNCYSDGSHWSRIMPKPRSASSMSDWTFTQTQLCDNLTISQHPQHPSYNFSLECEESVSHNKSITQSKTPGSIFSVNFGDSCLADYIDTCCRDQQPVPNIIHYVWFGTKELAYFNFLSLMSSLRFQKPCLILIHGPTLPHGVYWDYFLSLFSNVVHVFRESPTEVFGNKLQFKEHASDVMRIEALIKYGGIYLDFDELILRSLEPLRQYNHTQGHEMPFTMGSQLVMSAKNTKFLQLWYNSYRDNYKKLWAINALWVPNGLAKKHPELIHVEGYNFTRPSWKHVKDIFDKNYDWSTNYGMHMFARWYKRPIDVNIIRTLNTTVGSVSRHILFGNKEICES